MRFLEIASQLRNTQLCAGLMVELILNAAVILFDAKKHCSVREIERTKDSVRKKKVHVREDSREIRNEN